MKDIEDSYIFPTTSCIWQIRAGDFFCKKTFINTAIRIFGRMFAISVKRNRLYCNVLSLFSFSDHDMEYLTLNIILRKSKLIRISTAVSVSVYNLIDYYGKRFLILLMKFVHNSTIFFSFIIFKRVLIKFAYFPH